MCFSQSVGMEACWQGSVNGIKLLASDNPWGPQYRYSSVKSTWVDSRGPGSSHSVQESRLLTTESSLSQKQRQSQIFFRDLEKTPPQDSEAEACAAKILGTCSLLFQL